MKTKIYLLAVILLGSITSYSQKKSGIISFSFNGKYSQDNFASGDTKVELPSLYFVYDNSTRIDTVRTSDEILHYTQQVLAKFLGYPLIAVDENRLGSVPDQLEGGLWVMESISEKKAFQQLGYDEAIRIQARIYSTGSKNRTYTPGIEVSVKVINKEGKTTFKNSEKLKFKEEGVPESSLVLKSNSGGLSLRDGINLIKGGGSANIGDDNSKIGVNGARLFDWYQQCLSDVLIEKK
ncbi:MAG: hypothetical protein SGJ00_12130 [bacterium]|nr:hypothetical protein [bacterium]